jgi:cytochrome c oxidase cbb3-type subunit III
MSSQPTPVDFNAQPDPNEPPLTDHAYDGIMEYDNPTPGWWTWIFVGTVVFSALYFLVVTLAGGEFSANSWYASAKQEELKRQYGELGALAMDADASVFQLMGEPKWLDVGQSLYNTHCVACHGKGGGGVTAPNLTDDHWLYVKTPRDITDVILNGRKNGAMPAWKNTLQGPEPLIVAAYVASLRGTGATGRGVEGEVIPAWKK